MRLSNRGQLLLQIFISVNLERNGEDFDYGDKGCVLRRELLDGELKGRGEERVRRGIPGNIEGEPREIGIHVHCSTREGVYTHAFSHIEERDAGISGKCCG